MSIQVSQRIQKIKPSATLAVAAKATELKAKGHNVIDLSVGEPDFDTPNPIKEAAIEAIKSGFTKYTPVGGTASLKNAIIEKFSHENQLHYKPTQILVSCGAKQSFFNLTQALLNDGDEVIIPAPYWVSYPEIVLMAGGLPVIIPSTIEDHFKITPAKLQAALTDKTRLFVINSPSNPTGMAYTHEELLALGEVLQGYPQVVIASDDIYEHILWKQSSFWNILNACPDLYARTIVINGVSKAYAMTGWRIGYAAGPENIIKAMTTVQSQSTSNPTSISQVAAENALQGNQQCIQPMVKAFRERHDYAVAALNQLPGIECIRTDGTFYLLPKVSGAIDKLPHVHNDLEFAEFLLNQAELAVVPGSAFGAPGHIRLSIALSLENLTSAVERLREVLVS